MKGGPVEAGVTASSSILALRPQLAARSSWWGKRAMPGWARWASCWGRGKATLPWRKGPAASPHWPSLAACCCCCWLRASRAKGPWRSERATAGLVSESLVLFLWRWTKGQSTVFNLNSFGFKTKDLNIIAFILLIKPSRAKMNDGTAEIWKETTCKAGCSEQCQQVVANCVHWGRCPWVAVSLLLS